MSPARPRPPSCTPPGPRQPTATLVSRADGSAPVPLRGVLGIEETELSFRSDLPKALGGKGTQLSAHVYFSEEVAQRLEVLPGDKVLLGGLRLTAKRG